MKTATVATLALLFSLGVAAAGVARADAPTADRVILVGQLLEAKGRVGEPSGSLVTLHLPITLPE